MKKFWLGFAAGIVFSALSLFIFYMVMSNKWADALSDGYQPQENLAAPIEIPEKGVVNYQELKDDSKPIITLFYVDWCGYCVRFMPKFAQYSEKYAKEFSFALVNCDSPENKDFVNENNIRSFPTLKIIDKQLDYVVPIDVAATQSEKIFDVEVKKHLKLREKINK